jgi:pantoate--beta-alanine ligase
MARDLSFPVEVVGCATVRAHDGLALSSRNAYLTGEERTAAPVLHRALEAGADAIAAGEREPGRIREVMGAVLATEPLVTLDYAVVVDAATLDTPEALDGDLRLLVAARLPSARLIDNMGVTLTGTHRKDTRCVAG